MTYNTVKIRKVTKPGETISVAHYNLGIFVGNRNKQIAIGRYIITTPDGNEKDTTLDFIKLSYVAVRPVNMGENGNYKPKNSPPPPNCS